MGLLTHQEVEAVMVAAIQGSGPLTEAEMEGIVDWARLAKTQSLLLQLIREGRVSIDVRGPEPTFALKEAAATTEGAEA